MASNKHILVFIDWFEPGFKAGGPIRSMANLVAQLNDYSFSIVTSIYDHGCTVPYPNITPNEWVSLNNRVRVKYLERYQETSTNVRALLSETDYDKIYLNSLFSKKYTLLPLRLISKMGLSAKTILAPRGMLKEGALTKNSKKKKLFLTIAKAIGLFNGISWHATNEKEAEEIKLHFPKANEIRIAPNLCRPASDISLPLNKQAGSIKLVTVARVATEKNILGALTYLGQVDNGIIDWDIYGTMEDTHYLAKCQEWAAKIKHANIKFHGEIAPQLIPGKLKASHFLFLPTLGENYGHAIVESFLEGVPVIISNKTPWRSLEQRNAGWDLNLDKLVFKAVLEHCIDLKNEGYTHLCQGAADLGKEIANDESALRSNLELFA
jgi:glycosyltransferase involved in cell wall biosynthesis